MLTGYALRAKPLNEQTKPWYARLDTDARCMGLTHNPREALAFYSITDAERFAAKHLAPDVTWEVVPVQVARLVPDAGDYPDTVSEADLDAIIALLSRPPAFAPSMRWLEGEHIVDGPNLPILSLSADQIQSGSMLTIPLDPDTGKALP